MTDGRVHLVGTLLRDGVTDHVVPLDDVASLLLALTTAPLIEPDGGTGHSSPA